jgi:hypothetical protein
MAASAQFDPGQAYASAAPPSAQSTAAFDPSASYAPVDTEQEGVTKNPDDSFVITPKVDAEGNEESFSDTMQRAAEAGKKVSPELIQKQTVKGLKEAPEVLGAAAGIGAAGPAALAVAGEAGLGKLAKYPLLGKLLSTGADWITKNPGTVAYVALQESGMLNKLPESVKLPLALYLLGGKGGAAEGEAAGGTEATEGAKVAESAPASSTPSPSEPVTSAAPTTTAAPKETADEFINRVTGTKPGEPAGDYGIRPSEPVSEDAEDSQLTKEQRQAQVDKYFEENPDKKPQPETWKRGPNKGQPKTYKVFDGGEWKTVQRYK